MAPIRRWNPTFTMLLALEEDSEYAGNPLSHVIPGDRRGALPELLPYTYRGGDYSTPEPAPLKFSRRPRRRQGSPPVDPGWLNVPFSAPR